MEMSEKTNTHRASGSFLIDTFLIRILTYKQTNAEILMMILKLWENLKIWQMTLKNRLTFSTWDSE